MRYLLERMISKRTVLISWNILPILVLLYYFGASESCCLDSSLDYIFEDILSDVCPILSSATSKVKDLFLSSSSGMILFLSNFLSARCTTLLLRLYGPLVVFLKSDRDVFLKSLTYIKKLKTLNFHE